MRWQPRFVFPHHGAECVVSVRLFYDALGDRLWLLVSKRRADCVARPRTPGPGSMQEKK